MNDSAPYPVSKIPLQASKWIQLQALLDPVEMRTFFDALGEFSLYLVGKVLPLGDEKITKEQFLKTYEEYIEALRSGASAEIMTAFRNAFALVLTRADDHLFITNVPEARGIARACLPIIQMQLHTIGYSVIENKFRPMVLGKEGLHWGIQLSYPQLFQHPKTKEICNVLQESCFPNTQLFRLIQKWIREHTVPTPFFAQGKKVNVPMRIGKECFSWIHEHPQIRLLGIEVLEQKKIL